MKQVIGMALAAALLTSAGAADAQTNFGSRGAVVDETPSKQPILEGRSIYRGTRGVEQSTVPEPYEGNNPNVPQITRQPFSGGE